MNKKVWFRKVLVLASIVLFVGTGMIPSTVSVLEKKTTFTGSISPGYIQDLIDNASNGDTIYIPSGTYYENIIINKSISLVGEDKNTTIIDGSNVGDVVCVSVDWVNISGFTIKNCGSDYYAGILLESDYNNITDNTIILNNGYGIDNYGGYTTITGNNISNNVGGIRGPWNSIIFDNTLISNKEAGIFLVWGVGNTITSNVLINNGIGLFESGKNVIDNNTISNCDCGLSLDVCYGLNDNIFSNNSFFNTGVFIHLSGFSYENNTFSNNTVNGKPLVYLENESDIVIDDDAGQVILIDCYNITVQNQELTNTTIGLWLSDTDNCFISNNTISFNNLNGIYLDGYWDASINNNTITGNTINSNNGDGICFGSYGDADITNNIITGNIINSNNGDGISLTGDNANTIIGNTISWNNWDGIDLCGSYSNTITGNNINSNNDCGIYFSHCSNITISDNDISNNLVLGIRLSRSFDNFIINNGITSNYEEGILIIDSSSNNLIVGNTISENEDGIELEDSNNNLIYENTISSNDDYGIEIHTSSREHCTNNSIKLNIISLNNKGIYLNNSNKNTILQNNFLRNKRSAFFENCTNTWNKNYWNRPRFLPKLIFGIRTIETRLGISIPIPQIDFDWRPALKPYDIAGV